MKVMIIDDDVYNLDVMSIAMELEGFEVYSYNTGNNILSKAIFYHPNIILLDVQLGTYDGREICQQLKRNPTTKSIPVIMISAASEHILESALSYGADLTISKPFDVDNLVQSIKRILY